MSAGGSQRRCLQPPNPICLRWSLQLIGSQEEAKCTLCWGARSHTCGGYTGVNRWAVLHKPCLPSTESWFLSVALSPPSPPVLPLFIPSLIDLCQTFPHSSDLTILECAPPLLGLSFPTCLTEALPVLFPGCYQMQDAAWSNPSRAEGAPSPLGAAVPNSTMLAQNPSTPATAPTKLFHLIFHLRKVR